ncbi:molybdopterin molybdotransferase MoeA [Corynebacterium sp. p3-SID1056]|uniref:molybdopterin molybdotransferase MoeA n=1 Tax=Corynebacterium sp. p3-SID1056 TaxID=2916092 RepID=UPI0021A464A7|nr:molybdopterin molybdotransferase MoeA [Corynebacterium sp. p3-SID1056]MCT2338605.1 molybdopterin molybdotransferase MoeA [Corynebacterium sp. p3-SID1056]
MHAPEQPTARPSIAEHLDRVLALASPRIEREVPLDQATGHVLAAPVRGRLAVPPFANSAVDGFAVHAADVRGEGPWTLPVAGDVPAGSAALDCPAGCAIRVMTGAPIADSDGDLVVVPVEQTNIPRGPYPLPTEVTITRVEAGRTHIRTAGENAQPGDTIATPGLRVDAGTLAACVSTGVRTVDVYAHPTVAVVSTGSELRAWPGEISGAQIPDSNLPMVAELAASASEQRARVVRYHVDDDQAAEATLRRAAAEADLVITSGGVSAGAFDIVRAVSSTDAGMWFGKVAQRPGSPQGAGTFAGTPLVCLPGNPVAAFVSFLLYGAPLIAAQAGISRGLRFSERPHILAERAADFVNTAKPGVTYAVPVRLHHADGRTVAESFAPAIGSSFVASLTGIDGLAIVDAPQGPVKVYF